MADAPAKTFVTPMEDSRRWRNIQRRAGDIIISTPPKCGTTWTQQIVAALLWPRGDEPATRGNMSPWVDARGESIDVLVERLERQPHRRFLKTHSPGDCIPFDEKCRYITVYRDPRDALVSWGNHRAKMRAEIVDVFNAAAGTASPPVTPLARTFDGDYDVLIDEWVQYCSPVLHLASWWPRRHHGNVLFVHYADLLVEPRAEMQRIAQFLDLSIDEDQWPAVIERCSIDAMRQAADDSGGLENVFDGGASAFFNQGTNGRWTSILNAEQIDRILLHVTDHLAEGAAEWLMSGSLGYGHRPDDRGIETVVDDNPRPHPIFGRIRQRPANSIDAITDRRVEQAREDGLFDDLALHGKPIPDLGRQRRPGWWADQYVAKARNKVAAIQLEDQLRAALPALWRLETEDQVRDQVAVLNEQISAYNKVTTLQPRETLDVADTLDTWRRLKAR